MVVSALRNFTGRVLQTRIFWLNADALNRRKPERKSCFLTGTNRDQTEKGEMGEKGKTICVIGAGIIGLSTALKILEDELLEGNE